MDTTNIICQECGAWKVPPTHPTGTVFYCSSDWRHNTKYIKVTTTTGTLMNKPDAIVEHVSKSGDRFTQEIYSNGAAAWSVVKDAWGKEISMVGSGGYRPWEK
jgi:hypothetical protein